MVISLLGFLHLAPFALHGPPAIPQLASFALRDALALALRWKHQIPHSAAQTSERCNAAECDAEQTV